jgi:CRP/FNR family cyclic AMP-dependent transcriptional regulator
MRKEKRIPLDHIEYYVNPIEKSLQNNKLWEELIAAQPVKIYQKGEMIYWQGDHADYFYYLKEGEVCVFLSSENGIEKTLAIQKEGSVFGEASFLGELPRVSSARVLKQSGVVEIDKSTLMNYIAQHPAFAMDMLRYLSNTVRMLSAQVDYMTFLPAEKRIAQFIINLIGRTDMKREQAELFCSHEEIANMVGVSRVTVSKILSRFVKKGWIQTQYKKIVILDLQTFHQFAFSD